MKRLMVSGRRAGKTQSFLEQLDRHMADKPFRGDLQTILREAGEEIAKITKNQEPLPKIWTFHCDGESAEEKNEQRSEPMETYSTLEAMTKAKARPGTRIILGKRDVITYEAETETTVGKWEIVYSEGLSYLEDRFTIHDKAEWQEEQKNTQGSHGFQKVTDERTLRFLRANRHPGDWKKGDVATDGTDIFTVVHDGQIDFDWEKKLMPLMLVEDHKDRGDTP